MGGWHCKALSAKQTTTSATPKRGQHLAPRAYLLHAGQRELGVRRDEEEEKEKRRPPAANLSKPAPGPDSVFAKEGGGQRTRRGCSQQGGSRKLQLGGVRVGLQGQLCPRAAAHGCRPWGPCPPPPHAQHPSCGSKLVPKSDWTQTKDLQISCHGDFHLTGCFSTGVSGTVCGSGVHSRVGVRAAPLPPQAVPPSSCVGIETTTALPRRHRVTQFN